jgi:DNA-binding NarL/FixJ family response regulator
MRSADVGGRIGRVRATVLIVDDHEAFRDAAAALLRTEGFDVIGAVADGSAALAAVDRLDPDLVLLDIRLPGPDGFAIAEQLAARPRSPVVVLVSSRDESAYAVRLAASSARGFIAKRDLSGAALAALLT